MNIITFIKITATDYIRRTPKTGSIAYDASLATELLFPTNVFLCTCVRAVTRIQHGSWALLLGTRTLWVASQVSSGISPNVARHLHPVRLISSLSSRSLSLSLLPFFFFSRSLWRRGRGKYITAAPIKGTIYTRLVTVGEYPLSFFFSFNRQGTNLFDVNLALIYLVSFKSTLCVKYTYYVFLCGLLAPNIISNSAENIERKHTETLIDIRTIIMEDRK